MIDELKTELVSLTDKFNRLAEEDKLTPGKNQLALNAMGDDIQLLKTEINSYGNSDRVQTFQNSNRQNLPVGNKKSTERRRQSP